MPRTECPAPMAVLVPSFDGRARRRASCSRLGPLSWILGVAALAVGCSGKTTTTASNEGEPPAPKVAAPAKPDPTPAAPAVHDAQAQAKDIAAPTKEPVKDTPEAVEPAKPEEPAPSKKEEPVAPKGLSAKALLARVHSLKTSDQKALQYLRESEKVDSTAKDRAMAANRRGEKLFSSPERADIFFAWAQAHYPKHPLPPYNRAKLAAIQGNIAQVKAHLKAVKERKGKKLLHKVSFDPTFALVHDDPEIRSLIRSAR